MTSRASYYPMYRKRSFGLRPGLRQRLSLQAWQALTPASLFLACPALGLPGPPLSMAVEVSCWTPSETFSLVTCSWLYLQFIQGTGAHQSLHVSPRCTLRGAQRDAGSRLAGVGSMAQQEETIALSVYLCQYCDFRPTF